MNSLWSVLSNPVIGGLIPALTLWIGYVGKANPRVYVTLAVALIVVQVIRDYANRQRTEKRLRPWIDATLWPTLDAAYRKLRKADYDALESPPAYRKDKRDAAIREAMCALAQLTRAFCGLGPNHRVGANVMVYKSKADIDSTGDKAGILSRLKFVENQSLDPLSGVLDLRCDLSAISTGANETKAPDNELQPMALPVTTQFKFNNLKIALRGAAEAYLSPDGYDIVYDVQETWQNDDRYSVSGGVLELRKDYFVAEESAGRLVKSFVSIVITATSPATGKEERLGVVNIHSSQKRLVPDVDTFVAFRNFLAPVIMDLGELMR